MAMTRMTLADGSTVDVESNDAIVVHGVNASGEYLGLVTEGAGVTKISGPPPSALYRWSVDHWAFSPSLAQVQAALMTEIDANAGAARLRYVTDTPGQTAVYLRKSQQAKEYLLAYALNTLATVPPYIASEATATSKTPFVLATEIAAITALWDDQLSPAIEGVRIGGKQAVLAATTAEGAQTAANSANASLAAI